MKLKSLLNERFGLMGIVTNKPVNKPTKVTEAISWPNEHDRLLKDLDHAINAFVTFRSEIDGKVKAKDMLSYLAAIKALQLAYVKMHQSL